MMRRALFAFLTLFVVLANTAHVEAHASGRHSHDTSTHDISHHGVDTDQTADDAEERRTDAPATAEHTAGHNHVAADRSVPVTVEGRLGASGSSDYLAFAQSCSPPIPSAPLLEPPSA